MKKTLLKLALIGGLFLLISGEPYAQEVGLLSGSTAGTYIKIAQDIREISRDIMDVRVYPGGSLGNIEKILSDKNAQFAIVQYDALLFYERFKDQELRQKIKMLFPLYNEEIHLMARKDSDINNISDLNGKKVDVDKKNSGCWVTATVIKDKLGLEWQEYNYGPAEALKQLMAGNIDAFIYICGKPAPILSALGPEESEQIKLVPIELEGMYVDSLIEKGTYPWQENDIKTKATKAVLVSYNYDEGDNGPERFKVYVQDIRDLIGLVYDNLDYLVKNKHPKWKEVDPASYKDIDWPLHYAAKTVMDKKIGTK